jgi:enoyl-CoA hydratase/3-hydroxyacyl-CoA dehydrogenase
MVALSNERPIGVVGAGNMGSGIAQKIATEGFDVVLVDMDRAAAERGVERIRTLLGEAVKRKIFTPERAEAIVSRVRPAGDVAACENCALVIEAVFEDLDVKRDLFGRLDAVCAPFTRLGTNTSSFYVRDMAAATHRPDRVVGLHFFYHPAKNRLVEVIPGRETSAETTHWAWEFCEAIGKTPIASADAPGFVVNRYFVPWINEAVRVLDEGIADIPTIEAAIKDSFAIGMGPFELMNVTGIPIGMHAASTLGRELGAFYVPASRLAKQVATGQLWPLDGEASNDAGKRAAVVDRLQAVAFYVASQMVDEGVCTMEDADIGARVGLRWARGPFELANRVGVAEAARKVEALAAKYPEVQMPKRLRDAAAAGKAFQFEFVRLAVEDGVAEITVNRPDAMNALNEDVVAQLARAFDAAEARGDVRTIVLRGAGKAFVAGADIKFFVKRIEEKNLGRIQSFTQTGQELLRRIDASKKLVVARLDGLSLGGGSELALAADYIVATDRGSLGFPETGIGIYPGLGGTQRTTRRCGAALARYLVLTGESVDAGTAHKMGLVDEVLRQDQIGARILEVHRSGGHPAAAKPALDARLQALQAAFEAADVEALLAGSATDADPAVAKSLQRVRHKAPVACRLADRMIRHGAAHGIEAGLTMELAHLQEIFATADAYEGLSSLLAGRRPQYQGK